jgi:hypothetical protein
VECDGIRGNTSPLYFYFFGTFPLQMPSRIGALLTSWAFRVQGLDWRAVSAVSKVFVMTDSDDGTAVVVLVVEDETLIRRLANDMLSEAGYRVLEARDGQRREFGTSAWHSCAGSPEC